MRNITRQTYDQMRASCVWQVVRTCLDWCTGLCIPLSGAPIHLLASLQVHDHAGQQLWSNMA